MHSIKTNFDKILCILKNILGEDWLIDGNMLRPGPKPKFTDIEVAALSVTSECMGLDSENYLFHLLATTYKNDFPHLISRRQYNDRRKSVFPLIEEIRQRMAFKLNEINEVYAIDSMPLEVCKISRMERNKKHKKMSGNNKFHEPDRGFCSSQNKYFYGYKLHALCSPSGVIQVLDLTKASTHDIQFLKEARHYFRNCIITGDRGYISKELTDILQKENNICLEVPSKGGQKKSKKVMYVLRKIRKRIETVFSQLCDQFMIQRNYSKTFYGFRVRILSKITGMTILQYINRFVKNSPTGKIKYSLL